MFLDKKKNVLFVGFNWLGFKDDTLEAELKNHCSIKFINISRRKVRWKIRNFEPAELIKSASQLAYEVCMELEIHPSELDIGQKKHYEVSCFYHAKLLVFTRQFERAAVRHQPDLVVFMQGYPIMASVARKFCIQNTIPMLALENTFHKERFLWDSVSGITVNRNQSVNFIWRYLDLIEENESQRAVQAYVDNINSLKTDEHTTEQKNYDLNRDKRTVLFLGQVYTDASVLFGMNNFKTPTDIIETLVSECVIKNYHLILKLHPKELHGRNFNERDYNSLTLRKIKERNRLFETIVEKGFQIDYTELDTFNLIRQADVCVTINSQAGFEALLFGREVIACGTSFYTNLGVTFNAFDADELEFHLSAVLKKGKHRNNRILVEKAFYVITNKFFKLKTVSQLKKLILEQIQV